VIGRFLRLGTICAPRDEVHFEPVTIDQALALLQKQENVVAL